MALPRRLGLSTTRSGHCAAPSRGVCNGLRRECGKMAHVANVTCIEGRIRRPRRREAHGTAGDIELGAHRGPAVPDDGLAIDLRRADIEMALGSADDGVVELLLDLEAGEVDGGTTRRHTLAVGCTREDLERMLEDAVTTFGSASTPRRWRERSTPTSRPMACARRWPCWRSWSPRPAPPRAAPRQCRALGGQGGGSGGATVTSTRDMPARLDERVGRVHRGRTGHPGKPERGRSGAARARRPDTQSRRGSPATTMCCRAATTLRRRW